MAFPDFCSFGTDLQAQLESAFGTTLHNRLITRSYLARPLQRLDL
jgi:hypothetical protein